MVLLIVTVGQTTTTNSFCQYHRLAKKTILAVNLAFGEDVCLASLLQGVH